MNYGDNTEKYEAGFVSSIKRKFFDGSIQEKQRMKKEEIK